MNVYGIRCTIKSPNLQRAIRLVLRQIRERAPQDFKRIRVRVRKVASYTGQRREFDKQLGRHILIVDAGIAMVEPRGDGAVTIHPMPIMGQACRLSGDTDDFDGPVVVKLRELFRDDVAEPNQRAMMATIAHEFGHVCTREGDFHKRLLGYDDRSLIDELCADIYAYKWGFGRYIARDRGAFSQRPGSTFTAGPPGSIRRYRVTRSFRVHRKPT
jgi:hypothetical protein